MKAMALDKIVSLDETETPLTLTDFPQPKPRSDELLLQVLTCGVCHTELDEIEGRTAPPKLPVILGHEVVGRVVAAGANAFQHRLGSRVGVGWIHRSSGTQDENLDESFVATGRDVNGGYAEYMTVPETYAYAIPKSLSSQEAAPLLCAGAIGYRALRLSNLKNGDRLGLMGFGASAHLVVQLARHLFPQSEIFAFARRKSAQQFARDCGVEWTGDIEEPPPRPLNAIIDTTPAWTPIVAALKALAPGGRLVINAIRKENHDKEALLEINYHEHLWMEREIKSVANITREDLATFLPLAAKIPIRPTTTLYPLEDANRALMDLKRSQTIGANVLKIADV